MQFHIERKIDIIIDSKCKTYLLIFLLLLTDNKSFTVYRKTIQLLASRKLKKDSNLNETMERNNPRLLSTNVSIWREVTMTATS